jgi:hypothetical protein
VLDGNPEPDNEEKQKKHKWKTYSDHVKRQKKKQRSRIPQAYGNKISYTHLKMAM